MIGDVKTFRKRLLAWYDRSRRDLPWRASPQRSGPLDPYHVLVSETMLQQTQVATVIPYFKRFLERFPTLAALARADEQEVLRLWQGLGYYSRARNLQAAARQVVRDHGGQLPADARMLLTLPGVGRYTAGAVASIAFEIPAPILDGNVIRVLCRLDKVQSVPREPAVREALWARAAQIVPRRRPGDFNSALMELGATICTPRNPQCLVCPVREHCEACQAGIQEQLPPPRKARPTPLVRRKTYCIQCDGKWLIEQRPIRGRWAGMWQFVTVEAGRTEKHKGSAPLPIEIADATRIGRVSHALTHRRYEFEVLLARAKSKDLPICDGPRRWVGLEDLDAFPLPRPHVKIAQMLREAADVR